MKKDWFIALGIFALTLAVYLFFCKKEYEILHYFLPLANSILHGKINIEGFDNLNELVVSHGKSYVVYPPMPAIALIPFALIFSLNISQVYPQIIFAALSGAFFYLFLSKITKTRTAFILTMLLLFGTNFFMTSMIGRSWYFAHVCAVLFLSLSLYFAASKKPFLTGLFFIFAGLSRLPVLLALPAVIYFLRPKKSGWLYLLLPIAIGISFYLVYNFVRFGDFLQTGYSLIPGVLEEPWFKQGIFSLSYIPRNLEAIFLYLPKIIDKAPYIKFSSMGMALWLTTPALLLLGLVIKNKTSRVMILTSLLVLVPSLVHGTVGFSQFGYRFSLDFIIFLLIALIPAIEKKARLANFLVLASMLINLFAVISYYLGYFKP